MYFLKHQFIAFGCRPVYYAALQKAAAGIFLQEENYSNNKLNRNLLIFYNTTNNCLMQPFPLT